MEIKKKVPTNTITRDIKDLAAPELLHRNLSEKSAHVR